MLQVRFHHPVGKQTASPLLPLESGGNEEKAVATEEHGVPLMQPKWDQPLGPPRRQARHGVKTGDGPPHLLPKMDKIRQDPGRGVGGLRVKPLPEASH